MHKRIEALRKKNELTPYHLGILGEEAALKHLKKNKFKIIEKGYRMFRGEIDIIAYDRKTLVFIEVKTRRSHDFGFPEEAVTLSKQKQIRKIAEGYLALNNLENSECRFDILSIQYSAKDGFSTQHIKDAF